MRLNHIGCPDCIAGSTASTRSERLTPQLPFTGQSHTASSDSSGTVSSSQPATSHAATGPATAGVSSSSSSSTRLGTASEPTQLGSRSQAGRAKKACSSLFTELHAYGHTVMFDVTSCCTAHSTHPGCQGLHEMINTVRHWANGTTFVFCAFCDAICNLCDAGKSATLCSCVCNSCCQFLH